MKPKALVIAEKQLAAETMAKVLHCMEEKDGYFEGEDYRVYVSGRISSGI